MAAPSFRGLLLKLLPGFLPLIIYVVAEEFWGETVGLAAGIACGMVEFLVFAVRERRVDWLTLLDTVLLAAMGGVSLLLKDDVFFRIKPAAVEALFAALVGISAFGPRNLLMGKTLAKLRSEGLELGLAEQNLRGMMVGLFLLLVVHVSLTAAAALWWSREVWLFVSGGLFYLLLGLWAAGVIGQGFLRLRQARRQATKAPRGH
jgi:intracellular septation protein A